MYSYWKPSVFCCWLPNFQVKFLQNSMYQKLIKSIHSWQLFRKQLVLLLDIVVLRCNITVLVKMSILLQFCYAKAEILTLSTVYDNNSRQAAVCETSLTWLALQIESICRSKLLRLLVVQNTQRVTCKSHLKCDNIFVLLLNHLYLTTNMHGQLRQLLHSADIYASYIALKVPLNSNQATIFLKATIIS